MGCICASAPKYAVIKAGVQRVNGTYFQIGVHCDRPILENEDSGVELWYNEGQWRFGHTRSYIYVNRSTAVTPPFLGWEVAEGEHALPDIPTGEALRPTISIERCWM